MPSLAVNAAAVLSILLTVLQMGALAAAPGAAANEPGSHTVVRTR